MSFLQVLWFILIAVLFAGFFFLEGFDFGVGMLHSTLAKDEGERDQILGTIEPFWDGNEVWLLTAGGAMFASFPGWYASLFSGYYLLLFLVLIGLILRGVCFVFRSHAKPKGRRIFDVTMSISSFIAPFFLGVILTSMVSGVPIDGLGDIYPSWGDYFSPFTLVGGVAVVVLCLLHGLNFVQLKTLGALRDRANKWARILYLILFAGLVAFAITLLLYTDYLSFRPVVTLVLLGVIVLLSVGATIATYLRKEVLAFCASGATFVAVVGLLLGGLFPRVIINSVDVAKSLTILNTSSTPYTLKVMTIVTITALPFVLAYQIYSFVAFKNRLKVKPQPDLESSIQLADD